MKKEWIQPEVVVLDIKATENNTGGPVFDAETGPLDAS